MALGVATNGVGSPLVFPAQFSAKCSTKGSRFASSYVVLASPSISGAIGCCASSSSLYSSTSCGLSRLAGWFCGFGKVWKAKGDKSRIIVCPRKGQSLSLLYHNMHERGFKIYAGDQPQPPPKLPIHDPLVGHIAPDFEAEAVFEQEFIKIKLSSYFGKKFVVLFFYPLDFTFVCPTEITQFSDRYDEFQKLHTEVIAVSTDSVFSHLAWVQTDRKAGGLGDLKYPIASDLTKVISRRYGVLIADQGVALRGLFIIDKQGVIQHATINNLSFGRSVDETIRTLHAVQHVQQHPEEGCPAGWQPGDKPLKQGKDYLK